MLGLGKASNSELFSMLLLVTFKKYFSNAKQFSNQIGIHGSPCIIPSRQKVYHHYPSPYHQKICQYQSSSGVILAILGVTISKIFLKRSLCMKFSFCFLQNMQKIVRHYVHFHLSVSVKREEIKASNFIYRDHLRQIFEF